MVRFDMEYTPWGCGFTHTWSPGWESWGKVLEGGSLVEGGEPWRWALWLNSPAPFPVLFLLLESQELLTLMLPWFSSPRWAVSPLNCKPTWTLSPLSCIQEQQQKSNSYWCCGDSGYSKWKPCNTCQCRIWKFYKEILTRPDRLFHQRTKIMQ